MNIGSLALDNTVFLAPLAGITNLPFRLIAKEAGCGLVCSEMISANGLVYGSKKTFELTDSLPEEKPLSVQIFGSNPSIMAAAAIIVESTGADILDINFGCSVKKVIKTGAGAALMKDAGKAEAVLKAVRRAVNIPITIKIRSGWDKSGKDAFEIAQIAQNCGVNAITLHPRTAAQGFTGKADWEIIAKTKKMLLIPVIGNGDIKTPEDAVNMSKQTGCDAVMIGRAAIGNPWIIAEILSLFRGKPLFVVNLARRFDVMIRYFEASVEYFGEQRACFMMRSRLCWFVKGLRDSKRFRKSINHIASKAEGINHLKSYMNYLQDTS